MSLRRVARSIAPFMTVAVLIFATAALVHCHPYFKSADTSPCGFCLGTHSGTHAVVSHAIVLQFSPSAVTVVAYLDQAHTLNQTFHSIQDRAPPQN
jgi:hypothetical protein